MCEFQLHKRRLHESKLYRFKKYNFENDFGVYTKQVKRNCYRFPNLVQIFQIVSYCVLFILIP